MSIVSRVKQLNRKWIFAFVVISLVSGGVIFLLYRSLSEGNRMRQLEAKEMQSEIAELSASLKELNQRNYRLSKSKDSLQKHVSYFWPLRSIVYNAKLRDKVADGIDFKPGQSVRVKADSTIVIITDYVVGGNDYSYYILFRAKNRKGEYEEYSPFELEALN